MQDPVREIKDVVLQLTSDSPDVQRDAVYKYYAPDAGFRHPLSHVEPGVLSREYILGIYQWYRVVSPNVSIRVDNVVYDKPHNVLLLDIFQSFHLFLLPIEPAPSRFLARLTLKEEDGTHRIVMQEDFFHPDDLAALIFPPVAPFLRFSLRAFGVASNICAKTAQVFGYWRPVTMGLAGEQGYEKQNNKETSNGHQKGHFEGRGSPSEKSGNASGHEGDDTVGHGKKKGNGKKRKTTASRNAGQSEAKYQHGQNPYEKPHNTPT
ncbi:hypothetical protein AX15_001736 [Amanita polypyramis BW_CC]|nr:hypothetical protein AX15_001736 [Amanita polypyramis BW_CC]